MKRSTLLALIGNDLSGSSSPLLHEMEGKALGHTIVYRTVDLAARGLRRADLEDVLRFAETFGFDGLNVTHPYKMDIVAHLDDVDQNVEILGAANTVLFREGRRIGINTDVSGFADAFQRELSGARIDRVGQLGAGGAGAAVALALLERGVRTLSIFDIDQARGESLMEKLRERFPGRDMRLVADARTALEGADGVVQTTPIGMAPHFGMPLNADLLMPHMWAADVVYFPLETEFLAAAKARGCRTMDGGGMIVFQAAAAFEHFTGLEPSRERMLDVFRSHPFRTGSELEFEPERTGFRFTHKRS